MLIKIIFFVVFFLNWNHEVESNEIVFAINEKSSNLVAPEFLSFSIDFDSLLKNLNNSSSNVFVEHLSPLFVQVVDFNNGIFSSLNTSLAEWKVVQEWFKRKHIIPIFTINNRNANSKRWNPKDLIPFLELNEEMGYSCYWQLLYDCDYKPLIKYKEDLMMLKYVLDAYSPSKVIAANLRSCRYADGNVLVNTVQDLEGIVDAYIWDSFHPNHEFITTPTPIWIAAPKTEHAGFKSTLQWAKQIGEAAKNSYNVAFWPSDFNTIFSDTSVFWFTFLYKKIIGKTVLDVRTNGLVKNRVDVMAYCAKEYPKLGAIVIIIVNDDNQEFMASIKMDSDHSKYIDIENYILTSQNNNFTYLNGEKLSKDVLQNGFDAPKLQKKVDANGFLHLTVPAQAIGMFVLPDAQIPTCKGDSNNNASQNEEEFVEIVSKIGLSGSSHKFNFDELKNTLGNLNNGQKKDELIGNVETSNDFSRFLGKKVKTPKRNNKTTKLEIIFAERPLKDKVASDYARHIELQLTNEEIKKILLDRAKASVAEGNIKATNKQLEIGMARAARKMAKNNNNDKQKYKRFATNPKWRSKNLRKRHRRDIKSDMVKRKGNIANKRSHDLIADLAPAKLDGKNGDSSIEEEVLKSGEKYVDERVRFMKDPEREDSALEGDFDDSIRFYVDKIKREIRDDLKLRTLQNLRNRHNSEITIGTRIKKPDARFLKEKVENRKKMNDWIRARRKKNATRAKRSLLNNHDVYLPKVRDLKSVTNYVPKVVKSQWKPNDLRSIKKKPSYSIEDLDKREFLQSLSTLNRKQRKPRNTRVEIHLAENTIDDHILNKIPKKKFLYNVGTVSNVTITTETINIVTNDDKNFITTEPNITQPFTPIDVPTSDKNFFNDIVDSLRDFIETVYEKVSNYFMG